MLNGVVKLSLIMTDFLCDKVNNIIVSYLGRFCSFHPSVYLIKFTIEGCTNYILIVSFYKHFRVLIKQYKYYFIGNMINIIYK